MGVFVAPRSTTKQNFIDFIESSDIYSTEITGEKALRNSDIFTGINIISGDLGQSKFRPTKNSEADEQFLKMINKRPNNKQSHYMFMYATVANLILSGNSYALIHRDKLGVVESLEFVKPEQVNVIQNVTTGEWSYDVTMDYGSIMYKCKPEDILHFRITTVDGFLGRSPLLSLKDEVAMQSNGSKILSKFFANGVFGGGILKLKGGYVDNETKAKIRQDFEKANGGSTNSNGVIVLDESTEFQEYKMNTDILKLIQGNKFSTQQIAKVLGIPLNRFGMELVNSTDSGANDIYIASTISQYERAICDEIEIKTGNELELDLTTLLNDTYEDRRKRVFEGKQNKELLKAIKTNEIRDYLGYADVEEGEELMKVDGKEGVSASEES
ncbi:portal protein [Enterococcus phage vB_EfaS-SRH2]|jgi:HK97 family phage portal protein|uniref:Portal protein n=3 Tax=Efquatrovirus TaxID=2560124 RepID=A0A2I7QHH6_9CAUD|nr:portal protein [Enterococcus phage EfaCPT1]YP_009622329.1 portal protein [Enterococcus phage PMBT2]YP_009625916.1 portal protein [Enterococcus phage AUEF3]MBS6191270.1 phage portal protein [Haemophilus parainfluenzae]QBZ69814.1 portal (connector) protein [Enterococcus phage vB_EfaS_Ef5.4]QBZ69879.1 portal (connector) protein [Enterococcus phage vB_EfaS_Ef5.1]WKV24142.1 portal protein [Enterococcus phage SSMH02]WNA13970.1 portal (connector) protein [Enterococcus phage vB_Efa_VP16]WNO24220